MGRLIDADKFLERVKKDREHEIYLHSWTADMVLKRLDSWYAPTVEAIPKDQYEARLKADMVAMLTELQDELKYTVINGVCKPNYIEGFNDSVAISVKKIQCRIDKLKENNK